MKPLAKTHIKRLEKMLAWLDKSEAILQQRIGNASQGSMRASDKLDAASLRAVLAHLKAQEGKA